MINTPWCHVLHHIFYSVGNHHHKHTIAVKKVTDGKFFKANKAEKLIELSIAQGRDSCTGKSNVADLPLSRHNT